MEEGDLNLAAKLYKESENSVLERFAHWLDSGMVRALEMWRQGLSATVTGARGGRHVIEPSACRCSSRPIALTAGLSTPRLEELSARDQSLALPPPRWLPDDVAKQVEELSLTGFSKQEVLHSHRPCD